jgi:HD-GYP domain-containing protein (c-di-GMP phosphodiesterase class II)
MILTPVAHLEAGQILARPVPDPSRPDQDMLESGATLTGSVIEGLAKLRVRACWIRDERTDFLDASLPEELFRAQREVMIRLAEFFETQSADREAAPELQPLEAALTELRRGLARREESWAALEDFGADGGELAAHGAAVACLSLLLAGEAREILDREREEHGGREEDDPLSAIALGAALHDCGRLRLPPGLRTKRQGVLDRKELAALRKHPEQGFDLVRHEVPPHAANIVLNHHQRWDGHGYPARGEADGESGEGLAGRRIPAPSRLVAVANHFAAACRQRDRHGALRPGVQALFEMRFAVYRQWFDPDLENAFYRLQPAFPVGSEVRLSGGLRAVVTGFAPRAPCQPPVAILTGADGKPLEGKRTVRVDLAETTELHIAEAEGSHVSLYLF